MPKHDNSMYTDDVFALVDIYGESDDDGKAALAKKYPNIDFEALVSDDDFMNEVAASFTPKIKNPWAKILKYAIYISLITAIISGIANLLWGVAPMALTTGIGFFSPIILGLTSILVMLAAAMIFIKMANDISNTAKDTAEIKELLKNQGKK